MTSSSPRLAITGGTGFVGRYVINEALKRGLTVRALVRSPDKIDIEHENLDWIKGAMGQADDALVEGADCVIHIAGLIKARSREAFMTANAHAAEQLADAAKRAGVPKFVLLSSQAAGQPHLSDYAASKEAGERGVETVYDKEKIIIRAPAVFGPGDEATAPFFAFIRKGILPVPGGRYWKNRRLSMVFVEDLARFVIDAAVSDNYNDQTITPATITDIDWNGFAKLWSEAAGRPVRAMPVPLSILFPMAQVTSLTSSLFGAGHLTRGKLREFMHDNWSSEQLIPNATPPIDALKKTLQAYQ